MQIPPDYGQYLSQVRAIYAIDWLLYLSLGVCFALLHRTRIHQAYQLMLEGVLVFLPFLFYSICAFLPTIGILPPSFIWDNYTHSMFLLVGTIFSGLELLRLIVAGLELRKERRST